jgi:Rrf2 family protein
MKLSTKSRYGLRALFDMAYHAGALPVQIKDIARRQAISQRYLEQIFQDLKKAGLLKSRRGPQGGYSLTRPPARITVKDIVLAAEERVRLVDCTVDHDDCSEPCAFDQHCVTQRIWQEATRRLLDYFASVTLEDLCRDAQEMGIEKEVDHRFIYYI